MTTGKDTKKGTCYMVEIARRTATVKKNMHGDFSKIKNGTTV